MSHALPVAEMSLEDYLAFEAKSQTKHELLRGQVYAMSGGSPEHAALAAQVGAMLITALRGKPCRVFSSDLRIRIPSTELITYPDLSVVCDKLERDPEDPHAIRNPVLLVEVLSPSSEAYDRGDKAAHYRRIPSLREYLLVSQEAKRLELFRRNDRGTWELVEAGPGESLSLASVGVELEVDEVYRDPLA